MRDPEGEGFRKGAYGRLEGQDPGRWERLRGCTVTHRVFGAGTISSVTMPDRSDPLCLTVRFGSQEKTSYLSSFGDRAKFPAAGLPDELAQALEHAEREIVQEERLRAEAVQRRTDEAVAAAARRQEQTHLIQAQERQAAAREESARVEQAETRIKGIRDRIEHDQPPTAEEVRLLLAGDQDELLLGYYARSYARTGDYRAILKACAAWRKAKRPVYGLRATGVLLDSLHRRGDGARSAVCRARGGTLLDLHELAEAKEWALRALACERESPDAHQLLGAILMEAGEVADGAWRFATARQLAGTQGAGRIEKNPAGGDKAAAAGA